jgi:hypothetical protein
VLILLYFIDVRSGLAGRFIVIHHDGYQARLLVSGHLIQHSHGTKTAKPGAKF